MKQITKAFAAIIFFVAILILARPDAYAITVSSKIDTEGTLLANIITEALRYHHYSVTNKAALGGTTILRKAIKNGQIDIYPEYTGNGALFFPKIDKTVFKNFKKGYEAVKKADLKQNSIVWLTPARANNTWAIAVRKSFAKKHNIYSIKDFARYTNKGGFVKLICSEEFATSKAALPAFEKAYGFRLAQSQLILLSGGNTAQTERALARKINNVNFAMAYGTDGSLSSLNLLVLKDPKNIEPIYAPTPIVRKAILDKYPKIKEILRPIFESLGTQTLQTLNAKIAIEGLSAKKVAKAYLKQKGFIK